MSNTQDPLIKAARALCKFEAGVCQINEDDLWTNHAEDFKMQVQIVADVLQSPAPQPPGDLNLQCKSTQKRLATLWGFVPAAAQPQGDGQDPFETWALQFAGEPWKITPLSAWQAATTQASEPSADPIVWMNPATKEVMGHLYRLKLLSKGSSAELAKLYSMPLYAAPARAVEPLTPNEVDELATKHVHAFAQFDGAGEVWFEGELNFANAVIDAFCKKNGITTTPAAKAGKGGDHG